MSLKTEKSADISEILADIGEPVIWNGKTLHAIITSVDQSDTLQIGGFAEEYDFTVKIPKAALGDAQPKMKDPIRFDDKTWRISKVSQSPSYPRVNVECVMVGDQNLVSLETIDTGDESLLRCLQPPDSARRAHGS